MFAAASLLLLSQDPSSIAARVNNEAITHDELEAEVRREGGPAANPVLRRAILQRMATRRLFQQEAKRLGVRVETNEVNNAVQKDIQNFKTEENFQEWLARRQMTRQQYWEEKKQTLVQMRLFSMKYYLWIQDPTADSPPIHEFVTPAELRRYYLENRREFQAQEYARIARLTLQFQSEEEKAEKLRFARSILRRVEVGTDFVLLAQVDSDVKSPIVIDHFDRSSKLFSESITARIMDTLDKGQMSGILEDKGALHIVKVLDKISRHEETFEEAQPKIRTILEYEKRKTNEGVLVDDLIRNALYHPPDLFQTKP
jgi:hypothetical protein